MSSRITDPDFLRQQCEGDDSLIRLMKVTFVENAPNYASQISSHFEQGNWKELGRAAHGYLSSLNIVGARDLVRMASRIEEICIRNEGLEELDSLVKNVIRDTELAISELREG